MKPSSYIFIVGLCLAGASAGYYTLPACDIEHGGRRAPGTQVYGQTCSCSGLKIYRSKDAPADGTTESFCVGIRTNIKDTTTHY